MAVLTRPANLPKWATDDKTDPATGQPNVQPPTASQAQFGYPGDALPSRQKWNWLGRAVSLWSAWFDQQEQIATQKVGALETGLVEVSNKANQAAAQAEANREKNVEQDAEIAALDTRVTATEAFIGTPIGTVAPYYGTSATLAASTDSWLIMDGSTFDQTKFPKLRDHLQAAGKADPTKLPNIAGQVIIGVGGFTDSSGSYNYPFDTPGGKTMHDIEVNQIPDHTHGITKASGFIPDGGGSDVQIGFSDGAYDRFTGGVVENTAPKPLDMRQPYTALYYIIKAK